MVVAIQSIEVRETRLLAAGGRIADRDLIAIGGICRNLEWLSPDWKRLGPGQVSCLIELPESDTAGWSEVVPSFSALVKGLYGFRFVLHGERQNGEKFRASLSAVGCPAPPDAVPEEQPKQAGEAITAEIDTFVLRGAFRRLTLELLVAAEGEAEILDCPWLLGAALKSRRLSKCGGHLLYNGAECEAPVPAISQMEVPDIGPRICSPSSVAMLLKHDGCACEIGDLARTAFCPQHDLYGVWPWNIWAASRFGALGMLSFFGCWQAACGFLEAGRPFVASVRYGRGELSGAAVERETSKPMGHLLVVRGVSKGRVMVNDPAASTAAEVGRSYDLGEFQKVWLGRAALAYLLFPRAK